MRANRNMMRERLGRLYHRDRSAPLLPAAWQPRKFVVQVDWLYQVLDIGAIRVAIKYWKLGTKIFLYKSSAE